jgi:hypothetical protein
MNTQQNATLRAEKAKSSSTPHVDIRRVDVVVAERELSLQLPRIAAAQTRLESAKLITQDVLKFKFSI